MTAASELRAAADLLDRDGWCQGDLWDQLGRRCALGAFEGYSGACELSGHIGGSIMDWNDQPGQTAENVKATMRRLADELDAS